MTTNIRNLKGLTIEEDTTLIKVYITDFNGTDLNESNFEFSPNQYSGEIEYNEETLSYLEIYQFDADSRFIKSTTYALDDNDVLYMMEETRAVKDVNGNDNYWVITQYEYNGKIAEIDFKFFQDNDETEKVKNGIIAGMSPVFIMRPFCILIDYALLTNKRMRRG